MKCRHCGKHPLAAEGPDGAADAPGSRSERAVARVANLAEAGYLVSLLEAEGIEATVRPAESFNAVTGAWTMAHQISVADSEAIDAARLLRIEAAGRDEASGDFPNAAVNSARDLFTPEVRQESTNLIRPVTLLLVAAAVAWGLFGRNGAARNAKGASGAEPAAALGPALRSLGQPLYAADGPDRPRYRFRFDAEAGCWELAVDADRDGAYEARRRFQAAAN